MTAPKDNDNTQDFNAASVESTDLFGELVLMVDVFAACIETGTMPAHGSPCYQKARQLVEQSGQKPKRKRLRLPHNKNSNAADNQQPE